jgi:integrase
MLNKKREKTVSHENRFCVEGVCPSQFVIFPDQTGTATSSPENKTPSPNIINVMLWMKRNAYADSTIKATAKRLKHLQKNCDLTQPEEVKTFIANKKVSKRALFKECLIETYDILMRSMGLKWEKPFYARYDKLPKIPTEEHINMLISHARPRMALILSMSRDLGSRPIELTWLKVADINLQNGIVRLTGAKYTVGRNGKLRPNTLEMLKQYIVKKDLSARAILSVNQLQLPIGTNAKPSSCMSARAIQTTKTFKLFWNLPRFLG